MNLEMERQRHPKHKLPSVLRIWHASKPAEGEIVAFELVGMAGAKGHNNLTRLKNFVNSGLFIEVKDIEIPEWQIKFHPHKGQFHHKRGIRDTEMQLKQLCEIFDQTLNKTTATQ